MNRSAAAVGAVVVAVVATLSIPHVLSAQGGGGGPSVPRPPAPSRQPELPGTRTWQAIECPPDPQDGCAAPIVFDHAGVLFTRVATRRMVPPSAGSGPIALTLTVPRSTTDRWVLVGAEGAAPDSGVTVTLGGRPPLSVPGGKLSLFPLPGRARTEVTVMHLGERREDEVYRIAQYRSR